RRITLDGDETLWFGEWYGGKVGRFDVKTGQITEYTPSVPFSAFYQAGVDEKNHEGWAYDWHNDRLVRVNSRTAEIVEYPMPTRDVEGRRTSMDYSTNPVSVWIHGAGNGRQPSRAHPERRAYHAWVPGYVHGGSSKRNHPRPQGNSLSEHARRNTGGKSEMKEHCSWPLCFCRMCMAIFAIAGAVFAQS